MDERNMDQANPAFDYCYSFLQTLQKHKIKEKMQQDYETTNQERKNRISDSHKTNYRRKNERKINEARIETQASQMILKHKLQETIAAEIEHA